MAQERLALLAYLESRRRKTLIHKQSLEGAFSKHGCFKIKLEAPLTSVEYPSRVRIEYKRWGTGTKLSDTIYCDKNIGQSKRDTERHQRGRQNCVTSEKTRNLDRNTSNRKLTAIKVGTAGLW